MLLSQSPFAPVPHCCTFQATSPSKRNKGFGHPLRFASGDMSPEVLAEEAAAQEEEGAEEGTPPHSGSPPARGRALGNAFQLLGSPGKASPAGHLGEGGGSDDGDCQALDEGERFTIKASPAVPALSLGPAFEAAPEAGSGEEEEEEGALDASPAPAAIQADSDDDEVRGGAKGD